MELRKALVLGEVSVPYSNGLIDVKLTRQIAAYPSVRERDKVYFERFQVFKAVRISLLDQCFHFIYDLVNSGLQVCVIVLDVVDEFWQAPECISLRIKHIFLEL